MTDVRTTLDAFLDQDYFAKRFEKLRKLALGGSEVSEKVRSTQ